MGEIACTLQEQRSSHRIVIHNFNEWIKLDEHFCLTLLGIHFRVSAWRVITGSGDGGGGDGGGGDGGGGDGGGGDGWEWVVEHGSAVRWLPLSWFRMDSPWSFENLGTGCGLGHVI